MHPVLVGLAPQLLKLGQAAWQQAKMVQDLRQLQPDEARRRFQEHVRELPLKARAGFGVTLSFLIGRATDAESRKFLESLRAVLAVPDAMQTTEPSTVVTQQAGGALPFKRADDARATLESWAAITSPDECARQVRDYFTPLRQEDIDRHASAAQAWLEQCEQEISEHQDNEARIAAGRFVEDQMQYRMMVLRTGQHDPDWQRELVRLQRQRDRVHQLLDLLNTLEPRTQEPSPMPAATHPASSPRIDLKIFISHAWNDKVQPHFGRLCTELAGYDLWIDKSGIELGSSIRQRVEEGLQASDVVVVLWSAAAVDSAHVRDEMRIALGLGRTIVPCLIDDTPLSAVPGLEGRLAIDLRSPVLAEVGWAQIKHFMADLFIRRQEQRAAAMPDGPQRLEMLKMLASLKQKQAAQKDQISSLLDFAARKGRDATDLNQRNPYMLTMVRQLREQMGRTDSPQTRQTVAFLDYVETVFARLPGDDQDTLAMRNTLLLTRISEIDPEGANPQLQLFVRYLPQQTGAA